MRVRILMGKDNNDPAENLFKHTHQRLMMPPAPGTLKIGINPAV